MSLKKLKDQQLADRIGATNTRMEKLLHEVRSRAIAANEIETLKAADEALCGVYALHRSLLELGDQSPGVVAFTGGGK